MADTAKGRTFIDATALTQDRRVIDKVITAVRRQMLGKEALSAYITPRPERQGDFSVVIAREPDPPHFVLFVGVPGVTANPIIETLYSKE